MRYDLAEVSLPGDRKYNQDRTLCLRHQERVFLAVADGMGGHVRGDLAAQWAVDILSAIFKKSGAATITDPRAFLKQCCQLAHQNIEAKGAREKMPDLPRTTLVVALIDGDQACWAHIGDSRIYWLRGEQLKLRSIDHSPVEALFQKGAITEGQKKTHPDRNLVSKSIGGNDNHPKATISELKTLEPGDTLLLCTDGLWDALDDDYFNLFWSKDLPSAKALNQLAVYAELSNFPSSDNVSAVACTLKR